MQTYLAVTPEEYQHAAKFCRSFAHVAYRIGCDSVLLRQNLLLQTHGGLLTISDHNIPAIEQPEKLCAAVLRECGRKGFAGVLLDFEQPVSHDRAIFAEQLGRLMQAKHLCLYVSEHYAHAVSSAIPLICTTISGGNFTQRLKEAAALRGGANLLALDLQRLRMDFCLPARTGIGTPLSAAELHALMERESPSVFFSPDLCARYFTYLRDGEAHFVLFDDADTLNKKLQLGAELGFSAAFFMWPEVRDIASKLSGIK